MSLFLLGGVLGALASGVAITWRLYQSDVDAYDVGWRAGVDHGLTRGYRHGLASADGTPLTPDELDRLRSELDALVDDEIASAINKETPK